MRTEVAWFAGACSANIMVVGDLTAAERENVTNMVASRRQLHMVITDTVDQLAVQPGTLVVLKDVSARRTRSAPAVAMD